MKTWITILLLATCGGTTFAQLNERVGIGVGSYLIMGNGRNHPAASIRLQYSPVSYLRADCSIGYVFPDQAVDGIAVVADASFIQPITSTVSLYSITGVGLGSLRKKVEVGDRSTYLGDSGWLIQLGGGVEKLVAKRLMANLSVACRWYDGSAYAVPSVGLMVLLY